MRRSSNSRKAFKREKLYIGIPANAFYLLLLAGMLVVMFKKWSFFTGIVLLWWIFKLVTAKDTQWMDLFDSYRKEKHIYDSLPRKSIWEKIPKGWGKDKPC